MSKNEKINRELLSKQIEIALKISSYAHFMCLGLFLVLKFILGFDGPMPYFLLTYYLISQANNLLFRLHQKIMVVSIVFFASSFIITLLVSLYTGGLKSPFLGVIIVATMGAFISSLKHGRFFLLVGVAGVLILLLNELYGWVPDYDYTEFQERWFTIITYSFIFMISGVAGLMIAKTSFSGYQAKKELEKKTVEIEKQKEILADKNKEITDSISYAKRIQEAIMPSSEAVSKDLKNSFVLYLPKDIVAGDFFWMERVRKDGESNDCIVFYAAADCTGHGVPGAMVSVICSNALNKSLLEERIMDTGKLLDRAREIVIDRLAKGAGEVKDGMDISLCALNPQTRELKWSGANNPIWILRKGATEIEEIKGDKQPIGMGGLERPFTQHTIQLNQGDTIYSFTDGYQDQFGGPKGKKFKAKQLKQLIVEIQDRSMADQKEVLTSKFRDWQGEQEQVDDVCLVGVRV